MDILRTAVETEARRQGLTFEDVIAEERIHRATIWRWRKGTMMSPATADRLLKRIEAMAS